MLKELINRIIWHPRYSVEDYEIIYLHRVNQKRVSKNKKNSIIYKKIPMSGVSIKHSFVLYDVDNQRAHIPLHRILEIKNRRTGEILYKKILR